MRKLGRGKVHGANLRGGKMLRLLFTARRTDQFMLKYQHPGNSVCNALHTVTVVSCCCCVFLPITGE